MLKLKLQYFGHLMERSDSLAKTLMLWKIEGGRRREWQRMRWLDGITNAMDISFSRLWVCWCTGKPGRLQSMGSQRVGHDEWLNWTECYNDAHVHCVKRKWSDVTIIIAFRKFFIQFWHLLRQEDLKMQVWIYKKVA